MTSNNHPGKIVIDLDGVIAGPKPRDGSYLDCAPNGPIVKRLRELKVQGWIIAIHTSRNVKTHDHNVGKITAQTVPDIVEWLQRHDVPYDEIWPNKPWPGNVGFYVDDRAVQPRELLELSVNELLNRARGIHFDPSRPNWVAGNAQVWGILDARGRYRVLVNGSALRAVRQVREDGFRTLILIDPNVTIPPGLDEQLRRLGARWARFESRVPFNQAAVPVLRELVLEGLTSPEAPIFEVTPHEEEANVLESRHFNHVTADANAVTKVSESPGVQQKLRFEHDWLELADKITGMDLSPGQLFPLPNGYRLRRALGGSLNHVLLRERLDDLDIEGLSEGLHDLWTDVSRVNTRDMLLGKLTAMHRSLIFDKSLQRFNALDDLLEAYGAGSTSVPWFVNGVPLGEPREVLHRLLRLVPPPTLEHAGLWHGDLCPGNIVLFDDVHAEGTPDLRLIDPRGTVDGTTLALFGDRRYDLGKLAHALKWGYDTITEGWRDCSWELGPGSVNVALRVWDEDFPGFRPNRLRLWDALLRNGGIHAGDVTLGSPVVDALAGLQLMTCAPLHSDDPERMIALFTRGLTAAKDALEGQDGT